MSNYPADDLEFTDTKVKGMTADSVESDDGWSLFLGDHRPIVPQPGMPMRTYGLGLGYPIRGLFIDGHKFWYRTAQEEAERHKEWVAHTASKYKQDYEKLMLEIKDEPSFETIDISGMGGGYERCCQKMLMAGLKFLAEHPSFPEYKSYKNIIGVASPENKDAEALDAALTIAAGGDLTGAQHEAVVWHILYIHSNGINKWLASVPADRRYTYPKGLPEPSFGKP